jgi:hypothetical protein
LLLFDIVIVIIVVYFFFSRALIEHITLTPLKILTSSGSFPEPNSEINGNNNNITISGTPPSSSYSSDLSSSIVSFVNSSAFVMFSVGENVKVEFKILNFHLSPSSGVVSHPSERSLIKVVFFLYSFPLIFLCF